MAAAAANAQASDDAAATAFLLLTLGNVCHLQPQLLTANADLLERVQSALQIRPPTPAAAFALGASARLSAPALESFWGFWQRIAASHNPAEMRFALHAVREMLDAESQAVGGAAGAGTASSILDEARCADIEKLLLSPLLVGSFLDDSDSATARLVGECCGLLLLRSPAHMLPRLRDLLAGGATPNAQQQALAALQTFVADENAGASSAENLQIALEALLRPLEQPAPPPGVALGAVATLNALVHHHPRFLGDAATSAAHLPRVWAALLKQMPVRADLKRSVDLGPFKQKIDDGLPIRKVGVGRSHHLPCVVLQSLVVLQNQRTVSFFTSTSNELSAGCVYLRNDTVAASPCTNYAHLWRWCGRLPWPTDVGCGERPQGNGVRCAHSHSAGAWLVFRRHHTHAWRCRGSCVDVKTVLPS